MRFGQGLNKAGSLLSLVTLAALCKTPVWNKPLQLGFFHARKEGGYQTLLTVSTTNRLKFCDIDHMIT